MKIAANAAFFLLLASWAVASCPVGIGGPRLLYQRSSRHISITVLRDGRPAKDALVEVYRAGKAGMDRPPLLFATTREDGVVALPELMKGKYAIGAIAADRAAAQVLLKVVSKDKAGDTTSFQMALVPPQEHVAWKPWNLSVGPLARHFEGELTDPTGSVIAAAKIQIFRKGAGENKDVIQLQSDEHGRFSAQLEDGAIAIFRVSGFRLEIVPFEVVPQGEKDLLIKMQLAASC